MSTDNSNKFKKPEDYVVPEVIAGFEDKTNNQVDDELQALALEEKQLDLEIKRESVSKIRAERQARLDANRAKTIATLQFIAQRKATQDHCNHRKGGRGAEAVMRGQGDDSARSVIFHKLPNGGTMVLCQRCGKEWHPANKWNTENGKHVPLPATPGWEDAIMWNTDNSPSGSSTFQFEKVSN